MTNGESSGVTYRYRGTSTLMGHGCRGVYACSSGPTVQWGTPGVTLPLPDLIGQQWQLIFNLQMQLVFVKNKPNHWG